MASNDPPSGSPSLGLIGRRGSGRGGRLPSFRGPRDLTLGGVQKKTFVPNIPVRPKDRKDEPKDDSKQSEKGRGKKEDQRHERGRGRGRGRGERGRGGRGRGDREVIQSHSIFEQGPSSESMKSRTTWGGSDPMERSSSTRTGSSIKKEKREPEETKRILDDLLRDDFVSDTTSSEDPSLIPIKLPLCDVKVEMKKELLKSDIKIKEEAEDDETESKTAYQMKSTVSPPRPRTAAELFLGAPQGNEELVFLQLPDTLPGEPPDIEDKKDKKTILNVDEDDHLLKNPADIMASKLGLCSIQGFSEGYIGKMQVRKSGRTTLVLGNVELDVSLGTPSGFLQDVVSIKIEEGSKEGEMLTLGHVTNKLICVPDFEKMMDS